MKGNNNFNEKGKNQMQFLNSKILINNKDNLKGKDISRKSNSMMGATKNIITNTPINIKLKTSVGNSMSNSVLHSQHNANTNFTNIPVTFNNLTKPTGVNITNADEKYTNINIIVNNNYIKAVNETHTQSNFRNDLIKIEGRMNSNMNTDKAQKKNKSFQIQTTRNLVQNRKSKLESKISSPEKKEIKNPKMNCKSLYGGFNNLTHLKDIKVNLIKNSLHSQNANCLLKNLKSSFANSHSNSNTNSTANSNRKFTNRIVQGSKVNSTRPSREASTQNLQTHSNIKSNNMSVNMNVLRNLKDSKNSSYLDTAAHYMPIKIEEIHLTKNPLLNPSFIHNSYSELARKLRQHKPNTVRTSLQTNNNPNQIYFSSVLSKQRNRSNDDGNFTGYKIKSFEDHKKLDSSNLSELEASNSNNIRASSRLEEIYNYEKSLSNNLSKNFEDGKLFNANNSFDNSFSNTQMKIKQGFGVMSSRNSMEDKLSDRKEKDCSMMYFKPRSGDILKNFEGPEELHYMYVNLNQRQKIFVHNLENVDQGEIIEDNLEI